MRVGFTGTQRGVTLHQQAKLLCLLRELHATVLHHGDCIGADEEAHHAARALHLRVELHPPRIRTKRAFCTLRPGEVSHPEEDYLDRNKAIVLATEVLIACPKEETGEELRSGTWSTVRYARRLDRPVYIIRPSGLVERE